MPQQRGRQDVESPSWLEATAVLPTASLAGLWLCGISRTMQALGDKEQESTDQKMVSRSAVKRRVTPATQKGLPHPEPLRTLNPKCPQQASGTAGPALITPCLQKEEQAAVHPPRSLEREEHLIDGRPIELKRLHGVGGAGSAAAVPPIAACLCAGACARAASAAEADAEGQLALLPLLDAAGQRVVLQHVAPAGGLAPPLAAAALIRPRRAVLPGSRGCPGHRGETRGHANGRHVAAQTGADILAVRQTRWQRPGQVSMLLVSCPVLDRKPLKPVC